MTLSRMRVARYATLERVKGSHGTFRGNYPHSYYRCRVW